MSPALNGSSEIRHFKHSNALEICNGITFDFYTGLPHMVFFAAEDVCVTMTSSMPHTYCHCKVRFTRPSPSVHTFCKRSSKPIHIVRSTLSSWSGPSYIPDWFFFSQWMAHSDQPTWGENRSVLVTEYNILHSNVNAFSFPDHSHTWTKFQHSGERAYHTVRRLFLGFHYFCD